MTTFFDQYSRTITFPTPPASTSYIAPKYLVGNVLNGDSPDAYDADGFVYFPDPGDGSGIEQALARAATAPGEVHIRPGTYDLGSGSVVTPLVVTSGCQVTGEGETTLIIARASGDQGVFFVPPRPPPPSPPYLQTTFSNMKIDVPSASGTGTGSDAVVAIFAPSVVTNCIFTVESDLASSLRYVVLGAGDIFGSKYSHTFSNNDVYFSFTLSGGIPPGLGYAAVYFSEVDSTCVTQNKIYANCIPLGSFTRSQSATHAISDNWIETFKKSGDQGPDFAVACDTRSTVTGNYIYHVDGEGPAIEVFGLSAVTGNRIFSPFTASGAPATGPGVSIFGSFNVCSGNIITSGITPPATTSAVILQPLSSENVVVGNVLITGATNNGAASNVIANNS